MDSIVLMVPGDPQGQPRPRARAFRAGGAVTARVYQPERQRGTDGIVRDLPITTWRRRVAAQVRLALPPDPWTGPVKLDIVFYFERTQELLKRKHADGLIPHTVKPDTDNAVKAIMDELVEKRTKRVVVRRGILRDDSCVCELHVRKWWCERGAEAGAVVTVSRIGAAAPALPFVEPAPMGGAMPAPQTWFLGRWKDHWGIPRGDPRRQGSIDGHLVDAQGVIVPVRSEDECFRRCGMEPVEPERRGEFIAHVQRARA